MISTPATAKTPEMLFYDGTCGFCHAAVHFVLERDRTEKLFRFAPLHGPAFQRRVSEAQQAGLPDSVVVLTADGRLLVRSAAAIHVARRLGGLWSWMAAAAVAVPRPLRDWLYDRFAAVRYRIFGRKDDACPVLSPEQRRRFELE